MQVLVEDADSGDVVGQEVGENCTRRTEQSMDLARALAGMVLPTPGTSSISRCPSASRTVIAALMTSGLPSTTVAMARRILVVTLVTHSSPARSILGFCIA